MARAIILFLTALVALALALAMTPLGPRLAKGPAEAALARALKHDVSIDALSGRWHDLTLRNIAIRDADGVFLAIDEARLAWSPASAFSRRYRVTRLSIEGADLLRRPLQETGRPFRGFSLPKNLPDLVVDAFTAERFRIARAVSGRESVIAARGAAAIGGDRINAALDLASADGRDAITLRADTKGGRLTLDARARADADGVIAALAKAGGALDLSLKGDAPFDDFSARLAGKAGGYGDIDASLAANLAALDAIAIKGAIAPGARLQSVRTIAGETIRVDATAKPAGDGAELAIARLEGAFGALAGTLRWRNDARALKTAEGEARIALAPSWRAAAQRYSGAQIDARFTLKRAADRYAVTLDATSERAAASLKDATTDLARALDGNLDLVLKSAERFSPLLSGDIAIEGRLALSDGEARIKGARARDATSSFAGDAALRFKDGTVDLVGEATIAPAVLAQIQSGLALSAPLPARIKARGDRRAFEAQIEAVAPRSSYRGQKLPPLDIALSANGAATDFGGTLAARARGAAGGFGARYRRMGDGALTLDDIDYRGAGFRMSGALSANAASKTLIANLSYEGEEGAAPYPGLVIEGAARLEARIARGRGDNLLTLRADRISGATVRIADATIKAQGPTGAMRISADAASAEFSRLPLMTAPKADLLANLDGAPLIAIQSLSFLIDGAPARLARPAQIAWRDGVRVDGLDLRIGDEGAARLDAAFAARRWRGDAAIERLSLGDGSAMLDLDAAFDTDRPQIASGAFAVRALAGDDQQLAGRFFWDGAALTIADSGAGALDFEIIAPARLTRQPSLRVGIKGPLLGRAAYDGPLEIIAPFLPSFAQALNGSLSVKARLAGTTERPAITGDLAIRDGSYTDVVSGLVIVGIDADARALGDAAGTRAEFTAGASGPGQKEKTIRVEGTWRLDTADSLNAVIRLAGANIAAGPVTSARADGELRLAGSRKALTLAGDLVASRLDADLKTQERVGLVDIEVVALDRPAPVAAQAAARRAAPLAYDVRARASERAFVRGRGLDSEWRADLSIAGDAARPLILGAMNLIEGDLDFSGRQFDLTEGVLQFDRLQPNDPLVRLVAEFDSGEVDARIRIEGRASAPRITLDSTPARPTEDVVALVLFGKPAAELSAFESLQAAQALANLSAVGPFGDGGVTGAARRAIGLDLLSVDLDADAGASSLTVGKYISDDVFVSARQDARGENGAIRIEFDVTDDITLETEMKQDGEQTVSANWKKDF